jgi:hypothetical protein
VNLKNTLIIIISVLIAFLFCLSAKAIDKTATDSVFRQDEKRISQLASQLIEVRFDDTKVAQLNEQLMEEFEQVLKKEDSFKYPFDSIHSLGKVVSDDGLVRIFTWYAIRADGSHMHSGFIQYFNKSENSVLLYPLIDKSDLSYDALKFEDDFWVYSPDFDYKPAPEKNRRRR